MLVPTGVVVGVVVVGVLGKVVVVVDFGVVVVVDSELPFEPVDPEEGLLGVMALSGSVDEGLIGGEL